MVLIGVNMKPVQPIPPHDRRRIAALAICPERTVREVYQNPNAHRASTVARITKAALELELPPPVRPEAPTQGAA